MGLKSVEWNNGYWNGGMKRSSYRSQQPDSNLIQQWLIMHSGWLYSSMDHTFADNLRSGASMGPAYWA